MALMEVGLDDKYRLDAKRIFLSGTQALVRLPMLQRERDRARGSTPPASSRAIAARRSACTTTRCGAPKPSSSSTTSSSRPASTRIWRPPPCGAASRSACFPAPRSMACSASGTARAPASTAPSTRSSTPTRPAPRRNGGVIALAGDDHGCQSSTLAHQSEQVFAAALMPVVNPATLQDYLDLGILGFALSRYSSCWVGFKAISETVESSASIVSDPDRIKIIMPDRFRDAAGRPFHPLAGCADGPGAAAARPEDAGGRGVRARQPLRPHRAGFQAGAARHHGDRQGLSRSAAGAGRSRHHRRRSAGAGTAHLQGRADLAAGRIRRPGVRRRPAGRAGGRGEARLHRGPAAAHSL